MSPARSALRLLQGLVAISLAALGVIAPSTRLAAEEPRDPFMFWPPGHGAAYAAIRPVLNGILWDAANPLALVEGEPLGVGQTVAGWRIVEIQPDAIIVEQSFRRETVLPGNPFPGD